MPSEMVLDSAYARSADEVGLPCHCRRSDLPQLPLPLRLAPLRAVSILLRSPHAQVLAHYRTDPRQGLSAAQVAEARRRHGCNELAPEPGAAAQAAAEMPWIRAARRSCCMGPKQASPACRRPRLRRTRRTAAANHLWAAVWLDNACAAGTPFWKLVLKQFDDLLVKVRALRAAGSWLAAASTWPFPCVAAAAARFGRRLGTSCLCPPPTPAICTRCDVPAGCPSLCRS